MLLALTIITINSSLANTQLTFEQGKAKYKDHDSLGAYDICLKLASQGDVDAQYELIYMYAGGVAVDLDAEKEKYWFNQAEPSYLELDNNDVIEVQYRLAVIYEGVHFGREYDELRDIKKFFIAYLVLN